jgi:hypothetical protein
LLLAAATFALALVWNGFFVSYTTPAKMAAMNDVPAVLSGYYATPNLFSDGLRWWHGTWIQEGIYAYRPLSAYLYWIECWIGLRAGWFWVGCIGMGLLLANCAFCGALTWRFTGSKLCAAFACLSATCIVYFNMQPVEWLAWFPGHQELFLNLFLMGAVWHFDAWMRNGRTASLGWAWALFVGGCLSKEHVYVFPLMALALALLRPREGAARGVVSARRALGQIGWMAVFVGALWLFRSHVIENPRNPPIKRIFFIRKPFLYWFYPFYRTVLTELWWFAGLPVVILALGRALIRLYQRAPAWLGRPFVAPAVFFASLGVVALYLAATEGITRAAWYLFDFTVSSLRLVELGAMMLCVYCLWLSWKWRRAQPSVLVWSLFAIAHLPAFPYLGWHYTIAAWFLRCVYWGMIARLMWLDVEGYLPALRARFRLARALMPAVPAEAA